jgi:hypothetical protein
MPLVPLRMASKTRLPLFGASGLLTVSSNQSIRGMYSFSQVDCLHNPLSSLYLRYSSIRLGQFVDAFGADVSLSNAIDAAFLRVRPLFRDSLMALMPFKTSR